jgi:3-isopropylmalate dehydrogenase
MLLRHSFSLPAEAASIESAVRKVLAAGHFTRDLAGKNPSSVSTGEMGDLVTGTVQ